MRGYYSAEEQAPDPDLGKSLREGWRNTDSSGRVSLAVTHAAPNDVQHNLLLHPCK
jgi:hypothetical protein